MKSIIFLFVAVIGLVSCDLRTVDKSFKKDFDCAIYSIINHDKKQEDIYDVWLAKFYFAESYLSILTGIHGNYSIVDPVPFYNNKIDCLQDIEKWKRWYRENRYSITQEHSDSIKSLVWKSYIWW